MRVSPAMARMMLTAMSARLTLPDDMRFTPKDPLSIGPFYNGRPGTGFTPQYARPGRNGRGAAADKRRARKARGIRLHKRRLTS